MTIFSDLALLLYVIASATLMVCAWVVRRATQHFRPPDMPHTPLYHWVEPLLTVLVLAGGVWISGRAGARADARLRQELLSEATAVAHAIDPLQVKRLSFAEEDTGRPAFRRLCTQMATYANAAGIDRLYSLALRGGEIVGGPRALGPRELQISSPGVVQPRTTRADREVFATGQGVVLGPEESDDGATLGARAPVLDPLTGEVLLVVAVDAEAGPWRQAVAGARQGPLGVVLLLVSVLLLGDSLIVVRERLPMRSRRRLRYVEAAMCAVLGVGISCGAAWVVYHAEYGGYRDSLHDLASARSAGLRGALSDLRAQMQSVDHLFAASEQVGAAEFAGFCSPLVEAGPAIGWGWVPTVPAGGVAAYAREHARPGGAPAVWERDDHGEPVPVKDRAAYYPVTYLAASDDLQHVPGLDLGSEPATRGPLLTALRTGLGTASEAAPLYVLPEEPHTVLVFQQASSGTQKGVVVAAVPMQALLTRVLREGGAADRDLTLRAYEVGMGGAPRLLAASDGAPEAVTASLRDLENSEMVLPAFAFGKAYVVTVVTGPTWGAVPRWVGTWATGAAGLLVTAGLTAFLAMMAGRRDALEQDADRRARALHHNEERYQLISQMMTDYAYAVGVNEDGTVTLEWLAGAFESTTGRAPQDVNLLDGLESLVHGDDRPIAEDRTTRLLRGEECVCTVRIVRKDGEIRWIHDHARPVWDVEQGRVVRVVGAATDITASREAEEALAQERILLRTVIDHLPVAVFVKDRHARKILVNAADLAYAGAESEDEVLGKTDFEVYPPDLARVYFASDQAVLQTGQEVLEREERLLDAAGREQWRVASKVPLRDREGRVVGLVGLARDVTGRRAAEAAQQLAYAQEEVTNSILRLSLNDRSIADILDKALAHILAVPELGLMRRGAIFLLGDDQQSLALGASRGLPEEIRARCAEVPVQDCNCWQAPSGRHVHYFPAHAPASDAVCFRLAPDAHYCVPIQADERLMGVLAVCIPEAQPRDGRVEGVLAAIANALGSVIARHHAEAETLRLLNVASETRRALLSVVEEQRATAMSLQSLSARQQALLAAIPDIVVEIDEAGIITWVNETGMLFSEDYLVGMGAEEALGGLLPGATEALHSLLAGRVDTVSDEGWLFRRDGSKRLILWTGRAMRDADGRITGVLASGRDRTDRRSLEEQLVQAQKMESIGRLAGGVSHDFNNMLQAILGYTDLALTLAGSHQGLHDTLMEIKAAAERSGDLTRQLLAFSRRQTIAPEILNLNQTVTGMLRMLRRLIGENIDMAWLPASDLWSVKIDPAQVSQILANLVVNARDAIIDVGTVTIETANVHLSEAYCQVHAGYIPGDYVMLAVSDTGVGMEPELLAHAFEPFFTTKEVGRGTGLGLATVYGISRQNNGFINVYSEPGQGTTLRLYLPRVLEEGQAKAPPAPTEAPRARGAETVLLVEDEQSILALTQRFLIRNGYLVLAANGPSEALHLARNHDGPIDLLITDIVMPEMNGKTLQTEVAVLRPDIRTLYMSGYTANAIAHHGVLEAGIHFIEKPFSMQRLLSMMREILDADA